MPVLPSSSTGLIVVVASADYRASRKGGGAASLSIGARHSRIPYRLNPWRLSASRTSARQFAVTLSDALLASSIGSVLRTMPVTGAAEGLQTRAFHRHGGFRHFGELTNLGCAVECKMASLQPIQQRCSLRQANGAKDRYTSHRVLVLRLGLP